MKNPAKVLALAACLCLLVMSSSAKEAAKTSPSKSKPTTHKTSTSQKKKPAKSAAHLRTGKLTAGEASNLETKEASWNREEHEARVDNHGRVTSSSRGKMKHNQKHAAKPAAKAPKVAASKPKPKTAAAKHATPRAHAATLKTSQLTASEATHVQAKPAAETPAVQEIHGWGVVSEPAKAPENAVPPKAQPPLHLPPNNARMF